MSRRRYLSTEVSLDEALDRVAQKSDFAALLYTWMIPHAEDDAVLTGSPKVIRAKVCPLRSDKTDEDVAEALRALVAEDLIVWLGDESVDKSAVYFYPESFYRYQSNVPKEKRRSETCRPAKTQENSAEQRETAQNSASLSLSLSPSLSPSPSSAGSFLEFYAAYPKHSGKDAAAAAFAEVTKLIDGKDIVAAARAYAAQDIPRRFRPTPARWLQDEGFRDHIPRSRKRCTNPDCQGGIVYDRATDSALPCPECGA